MNFVAATQTGRQVAVLLALIVILQALKKEKKP